MLRQKMTGGLRSGRDDNPWESEALNVEDATQHAESDEFLQKSVEATRFELAMTG